jgi:hypothetical protein
MASKVQEQQQQQQERQQWLLDITQGTEEQNPKLRQLACGRLAVIDSFGTPKCLDLYDCKHKVIVRLQCCASDGNQHYRRCTLKALKGSKNTLCPFHSGNSQQWKQANRREIPEAELRFMRVVEKTAGGIDWCHQVRANFFKGDFDFWNWRRNVYVQIDEPHHFAGMTATGHTKQSTLDFQCNLKAFEKYAAVVRVHTADIIHPICIYAAMEAAVYHSTVVLTASYSTIDCGQMGKTMVYAERLRKHLGSETKIFKDLYKNIVFI